MYLYLLINIAVISLPLILSFDKKVHFHTRWRHFIPAMLITAAVFISWDVIFTKMGVWGFNPKYLTGIELINLPIEEWLFFITVPYACVFTYEVIKAYIKKDILEYYQVFISSVLIGILLSAGIVNLFHIYTSITFLATAIFIGLLQFIIKVKFLGRFYFTYLIILVPFLLVNGILTGSFIEEQVVWYNDLENMNKRIFTIPLEDSIYGLLLILMNISFYEWFKPEK